MGLIHPWWILEREEALHAHSLGPMELEVSSQRNPCFLKDVTMILCGRKIKHVKQKSSRSNS